MFVVLFELFEVVGDIYVQVLVIVDNVIMHLEIYLILIDFWSI